MVESQVYANVISHELASKGKVFDFINEINFSYKTNIDNEGRINILAKDLKEY